MDLFDVAQACRRRWYITVPLMLLTLAMAGVAYTGVPTVYRASAVVGLAPSPLTGGEGNGIINNGGTIMLANLTAAGIDSPSVAQEIKASSGATEFAAAVVAVPGGQMPMLNLEASAHDHDTAVTAVTMSQQRAQEELDRIQANAGISERAYGVIYQVSATPDVEVLRPGRKKLVAGIVGLGGIVSILAGLLWDLRKSRQRRDDGVATDNVSVATGDRLKSEPVLPQAPAGGQLVGEPGDRADSLGRKFIDSDDATDVGTPEPLSSAQSESGGNSTSRHRR